jgi:hypothetical protein
VQVGGGLVFDNSNAIRRLHAELLEKLGTIEEKLDGIAERLEAVEEKLDEGTTLDPSILKKPSPLPLPGDPFEISEAVSQAIQQTGATSFADMGRVIKAARGLLLKKGKRFLESDLEDAVHRVDVLQRMTISKDN